MCRQHLKPNAVYTTYQKCASLSPSHSVRRRFIAPRIHRYQSCLNFICLRMPFPSRSAHLEYERIKLEPTATTTMTVTVTVAAVRSCQTKRSRRKKSINCRVKYIQIKFFRICLFCLVLCSFELILPYSHVRCDAQRFAVRYRFFRLKNNLVVVAIILNISIDDVVAENVRPGFGTTHGDVLMLDVENEKEEADERVSRVLKHPASKIWGQDKLYTNQVELIISFRFFVTHIHYDDCDRRE